MNRKVYSGMCGNEMNQGWEQLLRLGNAGVPHAVEILRELNQFEISFPVSDNLSSQQIDLLFYSSVHHAHRVGKLPIFLGFMSIAKKGDHWIEVRNCRETQIVVIDVFLRKHDFGSVFDALHLIPAWLCGISESHQRAA